MSSTPEKIILFFDGVCGLCNFWVDFVLKHDKNQKIKFSPLQGQTAEKELLASYYNDLSTLVLKENGKIMTRSEAVFRIFSHLGGGWRVLLLFKIIPRPIRDAVYNMISKYRYRWFGKKESCRIPSPEERQRFLD